MELDEIRGKENTSYSYDENNKIKERIKVLEAKIEVLKADLMNTLSRKNKAQELKYKGCY